MQSLLRMAMMAVTWWRGLFIVPIEPLAKGEDPLEYYRTKVDPRDNACTRCPHGEEPSLESVWVCEAFSPGCFSALQAGIERFGWNTDMFHHSDLVGFLDKGRSRRAGGSWSNLGFISRPGASARWGQRMAPLPNGVQFARGGLVQDIPSTTVLVLEFRLEKELADILRDPFSEHYSTYVQRNGQSGLYRDVRYQRTQAVETARAFVRRICQDWVYEHFKGVFASDGSSALPTGESASSQQDHSVSSINGRSDREPVPQDSRTRGFISCLVCRPCPGTVLLF